MSDAGSQVPTTSGLWFPFAFWIIQSGIWKGLSKKACKLYPIICTFADFSTGECFPSIATIRRLSGLGKSSISAAIRELEERGLLSCKRGGHTHSNRYRILSWPRSPEMGPGSPVSGPPGPMGQTSGPIPGRQAVPQVGHNYTHVTITKVTTPNNEATSAGDGPFDDLYVAIAQELGLKKTGLGELEHLVGAYGLEWVGEAFKEAVRRGKPTLKYMEGILKNWKRLGRVFRKSKREAAHEAASERRSTAEREREERARRLNRSREARHEVEERMRQMPPEEIAFLRAHAEKDARDQEVPAIGWDEWVRSRMLTLVANKCGIVGL